MIISKYVCNTIFTKIWYVDKYLFSTQIFMDEIYHLCCPGGKII